MCVCTLLFPHSDLTDHPSLPTNSDTVTFTPTRPNSLSRSATFFVCCSAARVQSW